MRVLYMTMPYIQANTLGRLHAASEPALSPLNRGYLYGDAIYEVWRSYDGCIFAWEEHWARLERSAYCLHMEFPWEKTVMLGEIKKTVKGWRDVTGDLGDVYIRLQVTRGGGLIGLDPGLADGVDYVLLVQAVPTLSAEKLEQGLVLSVAKELHRNHPMTLNPRWKTGNYLNNILCLHEARKRGADEVVITNLEGEITEAAVCTLGFIRGDVLVTPALETGILEGVTRAICIQELASRVGLNVSEERFGEAELAGMDECFLLSTTKDVQPVGCIDVHRYRVGADTWTRKLKAAFEAYASDYVNRHPEFRLSGEP